MSAESTSGAIVDYSFDDQASPVTNNGSTGDATITGAVYKSDYTVQWNDPTNATTFSVDVTPVVTTTYTATLTNEIGCAVSDEVIVTVHDLPTAVAGGSQSTCPTGSVTVSGATSSNGTIVWTHNGVGSLSDVTTLTPTYTAAMGDLGNTVTLTMTVTGENSCSSEKAIAYYTIDVEDDEKPTIIAPEAIIAYVDLGSCAVEASGISLGTPNTSDNCGVANVTNDAPASFPVGNTTVTWKVTDNAGLSATATQIVTVIKENNISVVDVTGTTTPETHAGIANGTHCPDLNGLQAVVAPSGYTYSPGTSQVQFRVDRLCNSGNWSFNYSIGGTGVTVHEVLISGDGTTTNASGIVNADAGTDYILFTIDINNVVGTILPIDFTISDGGTNSAIKDAITIQHNLKIIPQIVDFK